MKLSLNSWKYCKDQKANQYQSFNEALIDLQNDRIDALLIDRVYANYYLKTEGILDQYEIFPAGFESESFAVGVRPADETLLDNLNKAFKELYQEEIPRNQPEMVWRRCGYKPN